MNTTPIDKVFVVSLPRTGTKTMCQMLKTLGYDVKHAPGPSWREFVEKHDAVADTPIFTLSAIKEMLLTYKNPRFIYIDKEQEQWFASMEKVGLVRNFNSMLNTKRDSLSPHNICDAESLAEVVGYQPLDITTGVFGFLNHRVEVMKNIPREMLLTYKFSQGWEPLCEFLGKELPEDLEIPHLNQNTMFDDLT